MTVSLRMSTLLIPCRNLFYFIKLQVELAYAITSFQVYLCVCTLVGHSAAAHGVPLLGTKFCHAICDQSKVRTDSHPQFRHAHVSPNCKDTLSLSLPHLQFHWAALSHPLTISTLFAQST